MEKNKVHFIKLQNLRLVTRRKMETHTVLNYKNGPLVSIGNHNIFPSVNLLDYFLQSHTHVYA